MFGRKAKRLTRLETQLADARRLIAEQEQTIANAESERDVWKLAGYKAVEAWEAGKAERDKLTGLLERAAHQLEIRIDPPPGGGIISVGGYIKQLEPSPAQQRPTELRNAGAWSQCPACPHDKAVHDGMGCTASCNCRVPYHALVKVDVKHE